jgi:transcription antitermination factor NusG
MIQAQMLGTASWHVITTEPQQSHKAMKHLSRRGYGVYSPEAQGRALFPGYLLLWVWGLDEQWQHVVSAPGVSDILLERGQAAVLTDATIAGIQLQEEHMNAAVTVRGRRRRKRWRRRRAEHEENCAQISVNPYSA